MPRVIDVHHHLLPKLYIDAVGRGPITDQAPRRAAAALDWSAEGSLSTMDANGVETALLSVSAPGVWFGDDAKATALARACNDTTADLVAKHPKRFGMFATLALPDVAGSLAEIRHACENLNTDGFCLMSSYANRYPGDPAFAPVFDELQRRKAVVFVHPTASDASKGLLPGIPASTMEFVLDTTRAVMSLLYSGTLSRCPDVKFVFSHAGGTVPYIAHRMCRLEAQEEFARLVPEGAMKALTRQFYDTALSANEPALAALEAFVPHTQILYGSDYPFAVGMMQKTLEGLAAHDFSPTARRAIDRGNAERLFPRLAG
jgi:predicted TIM-barrel fold metal-dependent hydrolase